MRGIIGVPLPRPSRRSAVHPVADQRSAIKEFRSLDAKRTREGLTAEEETRHARLRDLVGPEGGAAGPKPGFDVNAAAARLRDSLVPAGLRNRPPPVPTPPPEPEAPPPPEPVEAAAPQPWDSSTPPYDPSAPAWDTGGAATPDAQAWDPTAQPAWDPNAVPADSGQAYDPNAPAWGADAAATDPQAWDPAAQAAWDPNAVPADSGQAYDPNAPAWGADAATTDPQAWDPAAQAAWDPNAVPADSGQAYDPNAPAWGADAAATDPQAWDPAAQAAWDPNAPFDPGASTDPSAFDPNAAVHDPGLLQELAAYDAQPIEQGAQEWDPAAPAALGEQADPYAAPPPDGAWGGEADPLAETAAATAQAFEGEAAAEIPSEDWNSVAASAGSDPVLPLGEYDENGALVATEEDAALASLSPEEPSLTPSAEPGVAEALQGANGEHEDGREFGAEATPADLPDHADPSGFHAAQTMSEGATDEWQADATALDAGFSLESGGSFEAAAAAAAPEWAAEATPAPWDAPAGATQEESEPAADLPADTPLSDLLEPEQAEAPPAEAAAADPLLRYGADAPAALALDALEGAAGAGAYTDVREPATAPEPGLSSEAFPASEQPAAEAQYEPDLSPVAALAAVPSVEAPTPDDFSVDLDEMPELSGPSPELDLSRPDLSPGMEEESFDISFDDPIESPPEQGGSGDAAPAEGSAAQAAASLEVGASSPEPTAHPRDAVVAPESEVPTIEGEEILEEPSLGGGVPVLELEEPAHAKAAITPKSVSLGAAAVSSPLIAPVGPAAPAAHGSGYLVPGVRRVVVHTVEGQVMRGVLENADLDSSSLSLSADPGAAPELIARNKVKAIFFMLGPGENAPPAEGKRVRVTFSDGRQVAGFSADYSDEGIGFFMIPGDTRTNTGRIWVYRSAVRQVVTS